MVEGKCPSYMQTEDWEHIIKCLIRVELQKKYITKTYQEAAKLLNLEQSDKEIIAMLSNIVGYLKDYSRNRTKQHEIRVGKIF